MSRVRIVGGGLTGILAAFQAHGLGFSDIELHERFDRLGGVALPRRSHGVELREGCIYFGPAGDPIRALLEEHGLLFEDFENRFGSVSPSPDGCQAFTRDFGGPALPAGALGLAPAGDESLASRIAAYPPAIADALGRYGRWHLGAPLEAVHESAATALAINRVYPLGPPVCEIARLKRADPRADELYAIPRALWGRLQNLTASLPRDGFGRLFADCRQALARIGVKVFETNLISPRRALAGHAPGETLVWAANPMPLFKAVGLAAPQLIRKVFATYVFRAEYAGPLPFYVQNFTAQGSVFRVYLYESGGQTLLTAECVAEVADGELRREVHRLIRGFGGLRLALGEPLHANVAPRWIYHSVEAVRKLSELRAVLAARMGAGFVPGAWEPYAKGEKFAQVRAGLLAAREGAGRAASAA